MQVQIAGMMGWTCAESVVKGKMLWIRVGFVAVLAAPDCGRGINYAGPRSGVGRGGFPLFMIVRNWRFEIRQKRPLNAEQVASNFEKGMQDKSKSDG